MVRPLSLAQHTLYADLLEQGIDDLFDPEMPENGSILVRPNRAGAPADHAYYQGYRPAAGDDSRGQRYASYLGRAGDPAVAARIARFRRIKAARAERTTTVRALIGAGLPRPDRITGRIIEAVARAGLFPDHAVLLDHAAYQTYGGVLGVRLSKALSRSANDVEARSIRIALREVDQIPGVRTALCRVDPSFASALFTADEASATRFRGSSHIQVDVYLASEMAILIDEPVRSIVLHGPGIPVTIPAPERWVVHSLLEQGRRTGRAGDPTQALAQVAELIDAVSEAGRQHALARAFDAAWHHAPEGRADLRAGVQQLPVAARAILEAHVDM